MAPLGGLPGIRAAREAVQRLIWRGGVQDLFPGGKQINGTLSRDQGNTSNVDVLRAGNLMGMITATGLFAPSIIGKSNAAYTSGTTMTLTANTVTELSRRIGSSGTFKILGPPSANGVVAIETVTYSALPTSTTATITALTNDFISGSLILPTDGSEFPMTVIPEGSGIKVTDPDGSSQTTPFPEVPIRGIIDYSQIINTSTDTSIATWIASYMNAVGFGHFVFDNLYQV